MTTCSKTEKSLPIKYEIVGNLIRSGKRNAILLSDIMSVADIDRRSAHLIIESLINNYGFIIGASRKGEHRGYFIPENESEFNEVIHTSKNTINSLQKKHDNLQKNFKKKHKGATAE